MECLRLGGARIDISPIFIHSMCFLKNLIKYIGQNNNFPLIYIIVQEIEMLPLNLLGTAVLEMRSKTPIPSVA